MPKVNASEGWGTMVIRGVASARNWTDTEVPCDEVFKRKEQHQHVKAREEVGPSPISELEKRGPCFSLQDLAPTSSKGEECRA